MKLKQQFHKCPIPFNKKISTKVRIKSYHPLTHTMLA